MAPTQPRHIPWVDVLRIAACFFVVLSHSCDPFVGQFDANRAEFLSGAFWGSMMRACVPLFVMISGVLLLPIKMDTGLFYRKRLGRIVWPLIFWSIITPLLYLAYGHAEGENTLYNLVSFPINFNYATTPLWYLYMLVGLYLFAPIISPWIAQASRKDLKRFLCIWGFTLFIPAIELLAPFAGYRGNYGDMGILGACAWNSIGTFYYFTGFLGYFVLGHYLAKYPSERSMGATLARAIPLFAVGYGITFFGFVLTQHYFPGEYAYLEIPWFFNGFSVALMAYALFMIFQKVTVRCERCATRLNKVAGLTFGIYLCHFFIVQMGYDFVHTYIPLPPYLQIPVIALLAFAVSGGVVWLLQKLPKSKYLIG